MTLDTLLIQHWSFLVDCIFLNLEALHLMVGYFLLSFMIVRVFSNSNIPLPYKFAIIYFSGTIFNNPAYKIVITISELFGIFAVIIFINRRYIKLNSISNYIILFGVISALHLSILVMFDEHVANDFDLYRAAVLLKLFVLAFNIIILFNYINSDYDLKVFINYSIIIFNIVVISYLVQVVVFVMGNCTLWILFSDGVGRIYNSKFWGLLLLKEVT